MNTSHAPNGGMPLMFALALMTFGSTMVGATPGTHDPDVLTPSPAATQTQPPLHDRLSHAVQALTALPSTDAPALLPIGTTLARAAWEDSVVHIDLTMPAGVPAREFSILDVEDISRRLAAAVRADLDFGGVIVRARVGPNAPYRLLEDFVGSAGPAVYPPLREDAMVRAQPAARDDGPGDERAGPVANAGHQPTGALSGVTVFAAAGHGWTAGSSSWFLQRPLLLNMIEDYGNIDQLNYLVHYLFNAGATVVPFRPVGYQDTEVVLDQDDPGVTYAGAWSISTSTPYYENGATVSGVNYRFAVTDTVETATARYTPNLPTAGLYPVYTWVLDSNNRTTQLYRIVHSGGSTEVVIDHRMVGRGWVWLGTYHFEAGNGGYVEISNQSAVAGNVIADAIRFGNGVGDVVGAGPGTVSGYPRDEEAQRYWAESETGLNAVGMPGSIYNCCSTDQSDNVGTAARWAREMNNTTTNNDRWRRVYLEFHSNASGGSARGTIALVTGNATTFQTEYATILGDEIEQDMLILDSGFEFTWGLRSNPFSGSFGAISTTNNSNEFDATILEVAFHDNASDAALMLDPKVRDAVARSSVHGIIKFLNTLPGSTVPLAFLPMPPQKLRAQHNGSGGVVLAWSAPLSGEAYGDPSTGYRVYRSANGYGFDGGTDVGNVLATVLTDVPVDTTTYFRVAAYNAGGESMPTETVAVRRGAAGGAAFLIVNGFDRVSRQQDPSQFLSGVGTQRRPLLRKVNSFDYVIQHAEALASAGVTFDSCANESVADGDVALGNYPAVDWISGEESSADATFDPVEQTRVTDYCNAGGNLFVSGAEIGWDLDNLNNGRAFYNDFLKADYLADDAATYSVSAAAGSIFAGIAPFSFDDGTLFYDVDFPDELGTFSGSTSALTYSGGGGGIAGVVFDGAFRVVNFGFPFETITNAARRSEVMSAIAGFFNVSSNGAVPLEVIVESRDTAGAITALPTYEEFGVLGGNDTVKSTVPGLIGLGSRYIDYDVPNAGTDHAVFVPGIAAAGKYEVFVTWGDEANCFNARFTVTHHLGSSIQTVNQLPVSFGVFSNANRWVSLGQLWFAAGQDAATAALDISEETVTGQPDAGLPRRVYVDAARWLPIRGWPDPDTDGDGDVDLVDFSGLPDCVTGPGGGYAQPNCEDFDFDVDGDVDLGDYGAFQSAFTGSP